MIAAGFFFCAVSALQWKEMNEVICANCGEKIKIDKALEGQIEARILAAEKHKHEEELEAIRKEQEQQIQQAKISASEFAKKQLDGERELLARQNQADMELERKRLSQELENQQRKVSSEQDMLIKQLQADNEADKVANKELREQLTELTKAVREERRARENAQLDAEKRIAEEEGKIRADASKEADERQRLNLAAKEKTIADLQKALDDAQRKAAQGSQQLQGEILELDFEETLGSAFRDDEIEPIAKGVNGADIAQHVKSSSGISCGVILWEIKRTKNWTDSWTAKLKTDLRSAKANVPVIISEALPKNFEGEIGQVDGVWICKPKLAIVLAGLLRKPLLETARERMLAQNRGDKAGALYNFVTSHEFTQQVESMIETYQEMRLQVIKERTAYEKLWSKREKQAEKLLLSTATIVGSIQGYIGESSMPKIKGLELGDGLE